MVDIVITGAGGQLGSVALSRLHRAGASCAGLTSANGFRPAVGSSEPVDLCDATALRACLRRLRPRHILHFAAIASPAAAYRDPATARAVNVDAAGRLIDVAGELGARLLLASTDLVFDGEHPPYEEDATPSPLSVYGRTKADAEALAAARSHCVVARLPLMVGVPPVRRPPSFFLQMARRLLEGEPVDLFEDEVRSPADFESVADACQALVESRYTGVFHLGGPEPLSRMQLGRMLADALEVRAPLIHGMRQAEMHFDEPRPLDVSLRSARYMRCFGEPPAAPLRQILPRLAPALRERARTS